MPCHNCRWPIGEVDRFCPECGTPVGIESGPAVRIERKTKTIWLGSRILKISWAVAIGACVGVLLYFLSPHFPEILRNPIRSFGIIISIPGVPLILILAPLNIISSILRFDDLDRTAKLLFFLYTPIVIVFLLAVVLPTLWSFVDFLTGGLFFIH